MDHQLSSVGRLSARALALLTLGLLPFVGTSILWLRQPSHALALYGIVPSALGLAAGTLAYAIATHAWAPLTPGRRSRRESGLHKR
jgi:hypothetical protein